jgi:hypothetical protein
MIFSTKALHNYEPATVILLLNARICFNSLKLYIFFFNNMVALLNMFRIFGGV